VAGPDSAGKTIKRDRILKSIESDAVSFFYVSPDSPHKINGFSPFFLVGISWAGISL
jgi:hypothetical protein